MEIDNLPELTLFAIGRTPVTLGGLVAGMLIITAGFVISRLAAAGIARVRGRAKSGAAALYIVQKLVSYGLVIFAVMAGLSTVGLNLSSLAVFAGAVGVGVGLGLQGVVKEFVSGLVLIFDRVLNIGDYVELPDGKRGLVQAIGPRAVHVRTNDNIDLIIPNSKFIDGVVVNWTLHNHTRRIHIPFSVAYGTDREKVRTVVLDAANAVPFTLPETAAERTQVWLVGFGESGLNFELLVWPTLEAVKRPAAMHAAYTWAIAEALECAEIEVPFPQMDVRLRSLFGQEGDRAIDALGLHRLNGKEPASIMPKTAGTNDAAQDLARPLPDLRRTSEPVASSDHRP